MRLILKFFNKIYNNKRFLIIFIFLASVLCSLIFLSLFRNIGPPEHRLPTADYLGEYGPIAESILQGEGFPFEEKDSFVYIAPGYPAFLVGIFGLSQLTGIDRLDLIIFFNVIISALSSCLLFLIAKEIFDKKIALIASLLWMSYPFNLWFVKNTHTEVPFILLFYAGLLLYILALKRKNLGLVFLGGFILGLSSLTRWMGLFLPFLLAPLIFFLLKGVSKKRQFLLAAIFLIAALLPFLFWQTYAFTETGAFFSFFTVVPNCIGYCFITLTKEVGGNEYFYSSDDKESLKKIENL